MAPGAQWTLRVFGSAGTSNCSSAIGQQALSFQAYGTGVDDSNPGNNTGTSVNLNLAPNCPSNPLAYSLGVSKSGPFLADGVTSVGTIGAPIPFGARAYFLVTLQNDSSTGVALANAGVGDGLIDTRTLPSNTVLGVDGTAPGPFQQDPAQPIGLPMNLDVNGVTSVINSGVICTAFGGAQCPASLNGVNVVAGNSYSNFDATVPLLPPRSCPGGVTCTTPADPTARIELLVPYHNQPLAAGCLSPGDTSVRTTNQATTTTPATATVIAPDGSTALASAVPGSGGSAPAYVYTNGYPPCPSGGSVALDKTLTAPAGLTGVAMAGGTSYSGNLPSGPVTFQVVASNISGNGTGFDVVTFTDGNPSLRCRDGNFSNPTNQPGADRCGTISLTSLSCAATGGAQCPSPAALAAVVNATPGNNGTLQGSFGTAGIFTTMPDGSQLIFSIGYTLAGVNSFTGSLTNDATVVAQSGVPSYSAFSEAQVNLAFAAGIALSKSVDKLQAAAGQAVTYTVDVVNGGNGAQPAGALFTDPLPPELTAFTGVSCVAIPGPAANPGTATCPGAITNNGAGISATLPAIPANSGLRFSITANAPSGGLITSVNNQANVQVPVGGVNTTLRASTNFAVPSAAEILAGGVPQGFKSVVNLTRPGAAFAMPGDALRYRLTYFHNGAIDITSFQVTDTLPAGVTYAGGATLSVAGPLSSASLNPGYNGVGQANLLAPGAVLGSGETMVFTIPVTVSGATAPGTTLLNQGGAFGSGIAGPIVSDNVDNTNPACSSATLPAPCLPAGVTVPAGSVPQTQTATLDPVAVPVTGFLAPNISKSGALPSPTSVQWQVSVANNLLANAGKGPMGFSLADPVPAGMTAGAISCSVVSGTGQTTVATCALAGGVYTVTGALDYTAGATPASASERIDIVLQGTLAAGSTLNNTATVTNTSAGGGTRSASASVTSTVTPPAPGGGIQQIPTLSQWGLVLLSLVVGAAAAIGRPKGRQQTGA
ncbi:MAG: hypothetical protein JWP29_444 [Rhodoferax sp.]|nr:hypothetical protein [Rhodoferax sp.]